MRAWLVAELANRREHFSSVTEQNANILEVLVSHMRQHRAIDFVLGETFGILGQAELFEPFRNLLHGQPLARLAGNRQRRSLSILTAWL